MTEYFLAFFIGLFLGMIGGGGSLLTLPVLIYLAGIPSLQAITYSLFIIGTSALFGAIGYMRKGLMNVHQILTIALPSFAMVVFTRRIILPFIPDEIILFNGSTMSKARMMLILFAFLLLLSSLMMMKSKLFFQHVKSTGIKNFQSKYIFPCLLGIIIGFLTGLVGAGGGFLIIPALVVFAKVPMNKAIGASLMIIALNSLVGFFADIAGGALIDWRFLLSFSSCTLIGTALGVFYSSIVNEKIVKLLFACCTASIGSFIILKEIFFK